MLCLFLFFRIGLLIGILLSGVGFRLVIVRFCNLTTITRSSYFTGSLSSRFLLFLLFVTLRRLDLLLLIGLLYALTPLDILSRALVLRNAIRRALVGRSGFGRRVVRAGAFSLIILIRLARRALFHYILNFYKN